MSLLQPFPVRPGETNSHPLNDGDFRTRVGRNAPSFPVGAGLLHFNDEEELRCYLVYCSEQMEEAMARWKEPAGTFADVGDAHFWLLEIERARACA
jgi:hypothetical protein